MSESPRRISDVELGERLRRARESAKIRQAQAAEAVGVARTTIIAIEKGQRKVRIGELQALAMLYGTSANALARAEAVHLDMAPRFRKLAASTDQATEDATRLLNDLVRAEVELEDALGIVRARNYPPERPILPGDVGVQAEEDADGLRQWLGLGPGPILDVVSILDIQLGMRVYIRPLDNRVSGLFMYDNRVGACVLLNAKHPAERLRQTGVHELAHFISARHDPEILADDAPVSSREERYAASFARAFLTPARHVRQRFTEFTAGQSHLTRRHIILLAHAFGVSREAMVRRLEELRLARSGTWEWFIMNGGITDEQARQVLGEIPDRYGHAVAGYGAVPPRLALLVREAWKKSLYSEGQLATLLRLDRVGVRDILDGVEAEEHDADALVELPH